ncbi:uncharacterized protein K444DRAFT_601439, partial [Hyaloscypha bicolor E]
ANDAAKEYHDAVRRQEEVHWDDFLADGTNIWQPARYLDPDRSLAFDKIPPLTRRDGSNNKIEQAEELLSAFFLPLLATIGHDVLQNIALVLLSTLQISLLV